MARHISPAMEPYVTLQKSLPKGTPFEERARAARELKMQLARQGAERPAYHRRTRRNPSPDLLTIGLLAGGAFVGYKLLTGHKGSPPAQAPNG